ncbi:hypothetical protein SAMN05216389_12118 [Oceanobacillus limi]|uniref:Uncharacterized protein n=1 Tax=Oceanobacillus limi TaxID=930131 RepID=A0A1I0GEQ6_9BACI|nr:hypothetical protein [Oceanobacillus limi]SET69359.1 hypothetical protein SAMN05216389_12118 [Oceanobacillus limi]
MDEKEYAQTIAEIREWLVKIDTNQTHQTNLLETINTQATNAFAKADNAEDKADKALSLAQRNEENFDNYVENERTGRRWLIGILITIGLALLPIMNSFYM